MSLQVRGLSSSSNRADYGTRDYILTTFAGKRPPPACGVGVGDPPHMNTAAQRVDVGDVQPGQLAPPQSAVDQHQDDQALVGSGLAGQLPYLRIGQVGVLAPDLARQPHPSG